MNDEQKRKCLHMVIHYGSKNQMHKAIEECAELIEAIAKYMAGEDSMDHVCEEVADVLIMAEQMRTIVGAVEVDAIINQKLDRQMQRIRERTQKWSVANDRNRTENGV